MCVFARASLRYVGKCYISIRVRGCTCMHLCVCACVTVRLCSYHHYPSQYPHVHVLISQSMSDEGSQAAESFVDLFRLLLRPHSEISSSSVKDHLQGKIIGS